MRVGYLGPPGTFCEEALLRAGRAPTAGLEEIPYPTVIDCFRAVREGEVPAALVPIENTIEGSVNQTLDQLAADGGMLDPRRGGAAGAPPPARAGPWSSSSAIDAGAVAPARDGAVPGVPARQRAGGRDRRDQLDRRRRAHRGRAARSRPRRGHRHAARGRALRLRGDRARHRRRRPGDNSTRFVLVGTEPAEAVGPGRFRTSIICAPRARPPGRPPRDPPGVRDAGGQPDQAREPRPPRPGSAATSSSSTSRAAASATCRWRRRSRRSRSSGVAHVTFLGSYRAGRRGPG